MDDVLSAAGSLPDTAPSRPDSGPLVWASDALECVFALDQDAPVALISIAAPGTWDSSRDAVPVPVAGQPIAAQPIVEYFTSGTGHRSSASRLVNSDAGGRLRYRSHEIAESHGFSTLRIVQTDDESGIEAVVVFRAPSGAAAVSVVATISNRSGRTGELIVLEAVAIATGFAAIGPHSVDELSLISGRSDWLAEGRWAVRDAREAGLAELDLAVHSSEPKGAVVQVSTGTWSTERSLPFGALLDRASGRSVIWQLETNGAWRWELGERTAGAYLALSGPTSRDHQWSHALLPGDSFESVPVTLAVSPEGLEGALDELTHYRRAARRPHVDSARHPVIFNDYMNTLMGDPTTERLLPLIDAAHAVGAEVFVIDAGWYDETGDWWDSVGEWQPSVRRFPNGLVEVVDRIRGLSMTPGLWLEPEVVGVNSPIADSLPREAFLQQRGIRTQEHERYHLDLRHPAARAHLDGVIDRLVADYGIGYFKLDYNINAGVGTDLDSYSVGDGLLAHNRAHLDWIDGVLDRHPLLVLENCASGAMRMDAAMLSRLQLQSTSDQQNPTLYPPIAASAPLSMLPEQAANWAYPQPGMSEEEAAFTLCTAMLGRFYLSGYINQMSDAERELVAEAVRAHSSISADIVRSRAVWPLGLPAWTSPWVALGLEANERTHVTVWKRPGSGQQVDLAFPRLAGHHVEVTPVFPVSLAAWSHDWNPSTGILKLDAGALSTAARTFTVTVVD